VDEPLILASGSPRRHELLEMAGIPHVVDPPAVDEAMFPGESPRSYASRLARTKAEAVASRHPGAWVLGADTVVIVDDAAVGKPADPNEAERMLETMAGRRHEVLTCIALTNGEWTEERSSVTSVWMQPFDPVVVRSYVETGEPLDKAGAYAAQGLGAILIDRIEGDFFTVMGLPLDVVTELLDAVGAL